MEDQELEKLYPELVPPGRLASALQSALSRLGSRLWVADPMGPFWAEVKEDGRSCVASVAIKDRLFLTSFWDRGVQYGHLALPDLSSFAAAIAEFVERRCRIDDLRSRWPEATLFDSGRAHERGELVDYAWTRVQKIDAHPFPTMSHVFVAAARFPRLRRLMPFTSMDRVCFSTTTGFPYSNDCPRIAASRDGTCQVFAPGMAEGSACLFTGSVEDAVAFAEATLPADTPSARDGTAADGEPRAPHVVWVLEPSVFAEDCGAFEAAVRAAGRGVEIWKDEWWDSGAWPRLENTAVVFHGSLGNAHRIRETLPWSPGAFCNTAAFFCSAWYPRADSWLLHRAWRVLPAQDLVRDASPVLQALGSLERVFIRPDSPLKPFSGRVVPASRITLEALDHGYYYEDATLPVVVAPVRDVGAEWRFVVVDQKVIAGSRYAADRKALTTEEPGSPAWRFAVEVAARLDPPDPVYVMDLCESDGRLWLLELNPFSGADLYGCDVGDVVAWVSGAAFASRVTG